MSDDTTTEVVLVHLEYIRGKQDEIVSHLRTLNGRMASVETRATVLETRAETAKTEGRNWGAGAGAAGGLLGGFFAGFLQKWMGGQ